MSVDWIPEISTQRSITTNNKHDNSTRTELPVLFAASQLACLDSLQLYQCYVEYCPFHGVYLSYTKFHKLDLFPPFRWQALCLNFGKGTKTLDVSKGSCLKTNCDKTAQGRKLSTSCEETCTYKPEKCCCCLEEMFSANSACMIKRRQKYITSFLYSYFFRLQLDPLERSEDKCSGPHVQTKQRKTQ